MDSGVMIAVVVVSRNQQFWPESESFKYDRLLRPGASNYHFTTFETFILFGEIIIIMKQPVIPF